MSVPDVWVLALAAAAGAVGSVTGIGGGVLLVPVLMAWGMDIKHAIALSALSVVTISNTAASRYTKEHLANVHVGSFLEWFAVPGAFVGALGAVAIEPRALLLLCGLLFMASGTLLWWNPIDESAASDMETPQPFSWLSLHGRYFDRSRGRTVAYHAAHPALGGALTFIAGMVSGSLGIGGSAFVSLTQHACMRLPANVAVTTSHLVIGSMALAATSFYLEAGLIDMGTAALVILGACLGAWIGSWWLIRLTSGKVRGLFLTVVFLWGLEMVLHGIRWGR